MAFLTFLETFDEKSKAVYLLPKKSGIPLPYNPEFYGFLPEFEQHCTLLHGTLFQKS